MLGCSKSSVSSSKQMLICSQEQWSVMVGSGVGVQFEPGSYSMDPAAVGLDAVDAGSYLSIFKALGL